jgi:hypothetical protein
MVSVAPAGASLDRGDALPARTPTRCPVCGPPNSQPADCAGSATAYP